MIWLVSSAVRSLPRPISAIVLTAGGRSPGCRRGSRGRLFVFSPHTEKTKGLGHMVGRAVHWAANRDATGKTNAASKHPQGQNAATQR